MLRRIIAALTVAAVTGGCFPAVTAKQPRVELTVRDERGAPVPGASFTLATYRYPFPMASSTTFAKFETDAAGRLEVRKRRDFYVQVALPDGGRWYGWAYCLEKPGYRAIAAVAPDFSRALSVVLEPSPTPSVCKWLDANQPYNQVAIREP